VAGHVSAPGTSVTRRALAVLAAFDEDHRELTLTALARRSALPLATTHRLVADLVGWGALARTPTGHYVIGIVGGQPIGPLGLVAGVNITTLGGLTAAASAETDIPQLHFSAAVSPLRSYELRLQMFFVATVATDAYDLNVRRDTAVTGSRIATLAGGGITNGPSSSAMWPLLPTVSETISFFVSFARRNGTGTFAPQGAPNAGVARTWVGLFDIGPANIFTTA